MDLVRSLQPWDILLIYCNNQFKKYITPLLTLARGAFSIHLLMSSQKLSLSLFTWIKLCYTKKKKYVLWSQKNLISSFASHYLCELRQIFELLWIQFLFGGNSGKVKVLISQSCPTLCHPMDCSPPGSSVHRILQARILEWVAISFSRGIFLTQRSNPGLLHYR